MLHLVRTTNSTSIASQSIINSECANFNLVLTTMVMLRDDRSFRTIEVNEDVTIVCVEGNDLEDVVYEGNGGGEIQGEAFDDDGKVVEEQEEEEDMAIQPFLGVKVLRSVFQLFWSAFTTILVSLYYRG
jgi:hypothetical protein